MEVDFDEDAVAGHDGVPLLSSMASTTHLDPFDTEDALHRLVLPELGPEGNYNLKALLRLCCGKGVANTMVPRAPQRRAFETASAFPESILIQLALIHHGPSTQIRGNVS